MEPNEKKKTVLKVVLLIALIIAVVLIVKMGTNPDNDLPNNNNNKPTTSTPPISSNFLQTGKLSKDSTGAGDAKWYIIYTLPGQTLLTQKISIIENTVCSLNDKPFACATLASGSNIEVDGVRREDTVEVQKLKIILNTQDQNGSSTSTQSVRLFFYNEKIDKQLSGDENILCSPSAVLPVNRQIPATTTVLKASIELLLKGELTQQEKDYGFKTEFPLEGLKLLSANIDSAGTATLKFEDKNGKTGGGSCRVGILWAQIQKTAKQFPSVKEVKFEPETLFQP